jgi:lipid-binding SYLF domain-containing protein
MIVPGMGGFAAHETTLEYLTMRTMLLMLLPLLTWLAPAQGVDLWDKTKEVAGSAVDIVESSVVSGVDTADKLVTGRRDDPVKVRAAIDKMAGDALDKLFRQTPSAKSLLSSSHGYAVFDSRVSSFGITTGFGKGVAVRSGDGERQYMRMASAGVNLGMGVQYFQVLFFFPDAKTYDYFIKVGWDGGADATGAAGKDAESMAMVLANGVRVFQLNEKGIMLKASLTGTRYWREDDWNAAP